MYSTWKLTILGCSAALPFDSHGLSGQILECQRNSILIDCGEGTQLSLIRLKKRLNRIEVVLITHLHGDHFYGLPGLISTWNLLGRTKPILIYGPKGILDYINFYLNFMHSKVIFEINIVEIEMETKTIIYENEELNISAFPLQHSIVTYGFRIDSKQKLFNINKQFIKENVVPIPWIKRIKAGEDYVSEDGKVYLNSEITLPLIKPISFAYCCDTAYNSEIAENVKDVTVLFHESTFQEAHMAEAKLKMHSTASQAAQIANQSGAKKLILGHFSSRYKSTNKFLVEASKYFKNTIIGCENMELKIK